MFSPQRKAATRGGGVVLGGGKGKAVSFLDGPSPAPAPPLGSLSGSGAKTASSEADMDDWRRFKEAGLLDEAAMVRRDHEALADKVAKLETQLFDYQYNMGLLLIEKEEWTSKFEELRQALAETHEILKREQTAHLIALSETEKREDNLRKALVTEKQCVIELEKALREMNQEQAKVRLSSNSMVAEANTLVNGVEEKSLELEKNLKAAEAKLAELNRKCTRLDIRLEEVEARESVLQKEQQTLQTEREAQKAIFAKQKKDLQEWEKNLQEMEESLCKGRRTLAEREEKENENERVRKQKQTELQELEKKIDLSTLDLKKKKDAISKQLEELLCKDKEADCLKKSLEKKGEELRLQEEKLRSREKLGVKQLLDEHKATLDMKMQELDLELEEKRKSHDTELSCKADVLRKKEAEINHREEKLGKREQAMHEKSERLKERNKESDEKLKSMKEREKVIKAEERKLAAEKQQLVADKESLQSVLTEVEKIKDENFQLERKICEERESLTITNKERSEHVHLQLELKQEMEKYRIQNELLLEKIEELKQERENFEKQWEDLDEKKSKVKAELKELIEEKENLEKLRHLEEDRLKKEKLSVEEFIRREMENLKLEKDSFAEKMKSEQFVLSEKAQLDHSQMVQDFESQRRNLETEMQNQQEKMDKLLRDRVRAFEEERERELNNIKHLKEVARKEREEVKSERLKVEKKREELALDKGKLVVDQVEMQNDIKQLDNLSEKIKHQREELIRERSQFLAFVEKLKSCNDDGEIARELVLSGFRVPEVNKGDVVPLPSLDNELVERSSNDLAVSDLLSPKTGERMSWLQKCTSRIFNPSPGKKSVHTSTSMESTPLSAAQLTAEEKAKDRTVLDSDETKVPCSSKGKPLSPSRNSNASVVQKYQFEKVTAKTDGGYAPAIDDCSNLHSKAEDVPEDSLQSESKLGRRKPSRRRASALHRTRSVQAAVKDAEAFLGEMLEEPRSDATNPPSDSLGAGHTARKRQRAQASHITESEQDGGDSEACSGSVTASGRGRKRRQTVPSGLQTRGEERYNFRRRKNVGTAKEAADSKKTKDKEPGAHDTVEEAANLEAASISSSEVARKSSGSKQLVHVTIAKTVEFSENRVVRFITPDQDVDDNAGAEKSIENTELSVEVNNSAEFGNEDESGSTIQDSDDDQGEEVQPGEASIGKKIWTFFTT